MDDIVERGAHPFEQRQHCGRVAGEDLRPQHRVARGDARDVAHALTAESDGVVGQLTQLRGDEARGDLRHVRDGGDGLVVRGRAHRDDVCPADLRDGCHVGDAGVVRTVRADDPGAPLEQVGARRDRAAALTTGHRMPRHEAAPLGAAASCHPLDDGVLHARHVRHGGVRPRRELRGDDVDDHVRRRGDDDEVGRLVLGVGDAAGAHVGGERRRRRRGVGEGDVDASRLQRERQRRAEQAGADDADALRQCHRPAALYRSATSRLLSGRILPGRRSPTFTGPTCGRASAMTG